MDEKIKHKEEQEEIKVYFLRPMGMKILKALLTTNLLTQDLDL